MTDDICWRAIALTGFCLSLRSPQRLYCNFPTQKYLAEDLGLSLSTVKSFLAGKPIDFLNFAVISEKFGLPMQIFSLEEGEIEDDWREAGLEQLKPFADLQSI